VNYVSIRTASLQHGTQLALLVGVLIGLSSIASAHPASAMTTITAYKAQVPVKVNGVVSPGEWSDTPMINETISGMTVAFKQNSTGLLFLLVWHQSPIDCFDKYCFGGIEIGNLNNTGEMGTPSTPTIMVLLSPSFQKGYDEFLSSSDATPVAVESMTPSLQTQSTCALNVSGTTYTAECYRPFHLTNASQYDSFPRLVAGSPIEIGFAVGEFSEPGVHAATDMSTYQLTLSNQTYAVTTTTSTTSTTSSSTSSTPATRAALSAATYAEELAAIVVGFSALMLVVIRRYTI
jgi:hypothetical protein